MWKIAEMEKYATDFSLHRLIKGPMVNHHIQMIQFYGSTPQINNKFTFVHITINSQELFPNLFNTLYPLPHQVTQVTKHLDKRYSEN